MDTIRLLINSIHSDSSLSNHFNSFIKRAGHQDYKSKMMLIRLGLDPIPVLGKMM